MKFLIPKFLHRFARNRSGASAIEFALLAPLMIGLYIGTVEISEGVAAYRKVTLTAGALANLTSQVTGISATDKDNILPAVEKLVELGFSIIATGGTAAHLQAKGLPVEVVNKVAQGRPHIVDRLLDGEVALVFNTTEGWQSLKDSHSIRATTLAKRVPYFTTAAASIAAARAIEAVRGHALEVASLQSYYSRL